MEVLIRYEKAMKKSKIENNSEIDFSKAEELAINISNGDMSAAEEFVKEYYKWLLFVIRRAFPRMNSHEDVVQDAFLLIIKHLKQNKINKVEAVLGYLRTSAINIGQEYLSKQKRIISVDSVTLNLIEDNKGDVLSSLIWENRVEYVKQLMKELTMTRDREILYKFYFEDVDKAEICAQLDMTPNQFDKVIHRAKKRLRKIIDLNKNGKPGGLGSLLLKKSKKKPDNLLLKIMESCISFTTLMIKARILIFSFRHIEDITS